jgi:hypothetical protein
MWTEFWDTVQHAKLDMAALELCVLLLVQAICLVFRLPRIGLMASYLFAYRWGWAFMAGQSERYLIMYLVFGSVVCILSVISFMIPRRSE